MSKPSIEQIVSSLQPVYIGKEVVKVEKRYVKNANRPKGVRKIVYLDKIVICNFD